MATFEQQWLRRGVSCLSSVLLLAGLVAFAGGRDQFITIGAGSDRGVYYSAAAEICRLVNARKAEHGIQCYVRGSGGSVYNIQALRRDELEFGIVQSDVQKLAVDGGEMFGLRGPFVDLRSLFSLHAEPFTVVARADARISQLSDLKGKRVNVGNLGSGQRGTLALLLGALGWSMADFELATELKLSEQGEALCRGEVDAIVFVSGHPNDSLEKASAACDVVLVEVSGPEVDRLVAENSSYVAGVIPAGLYRGIDKETKTFNVRAVLVTTQRVPERIVYEVVKAVLENLPELRHSHPALNGLEKANMVRHGLVAPVHRGAARYYEEQNLR